MLSCFVRSLQIWICNTLFNTLNKFEWVTHWNPTSIFLMGFLELNSEFKLRCLSWQFGQFMCPFCFFYSSSLTKFKRKRPLVKKRELYRVFTVLISRPANCMFLRVPWCLPVTSTRTTGVKSWNRDMPNTDALPHELVLMLTMREPMYAHMSSLQSSMQIEEESRDFKSLFCELRNTRVECRNVKGLSGKQNERREWVKSHFIPWAETSFRWRRQKRSDQMTATRADTHCQWVWVMINGAIATTTQIHMDLST